MKQLIITLALILSTCIISAENSKRNFGVDERYEFTSIVWKLADAPEYNQCHVPTYDIAVDKYFKRYKKHALIEHCKEIRKYYGVSYDAIATSTSYITIENGRVKVRDGFDVKNISTIDQRWTPETFSKYVELLDKFYRKSKFGKFFLSQKPLYDEAEASFDSVIMSTAINLPWFKAFFGQEPTSYRINLCINNGGSSYGGLSEEGVDIAILFGCCSSRPNAIAMYQESTSHIVFHELMHAFANPIAAKYVKEFEASTTLIYPYVKYELTQAAYSRSSIVLEWLTRISTLMYMRDNGSSEQEIDMIIKGDHAQGFVWQADAYAFMSKFDNNRAKYPTFESFIPELVVFLDSVANNMDKYVNTSRTVPEIVSVTPESNSTFKYSEIDTFVVEIKFSEKMEVGVSINFLADDEDKANKVISEEFAKYDTDWIFNDFARWTDPYTMQLRITKDLLIRSKCTGFHLLRYFKSLEGINLKEDVIVNYTFEK